MHVDVIDEVDDELDDIIDYHVIGDENLADDEMFDDDL